MLMEYALIVIQAALPVVVNLNARHVLLERSWEDQQVVANTHAPQVLMPLKVTLSLNVFHVIMGYRTVINVMLFSQAYRVIVVIVSII
jgi:hypothetical protein